MVEDSGRSQPGQGRPPDKVSRFWERFREKLTGQGVKAPAQRWYVVRVEQYIKVSHGKRLREHAPADVTAYLEQVGRDARIEDWQLGQTAHALQILFGPVLSMSWAKQVDWQAWRQGSRSLSPEHPTVARDYSPRDYSAPRPASNGGTLKGVRRTHHEVLNRVVCAIRSRHYSIRGQWLSLIHI